MPRPSSHCMNGSTKAPPQSFWPNSVTTIGVVADSVVGTPSQQVCDAQALKLYTCHAAARLPVPSVGADVCHCVSAFEYCSPPSSIRFVEPVERTASTSICMPAAMYG